VRKVPKRLNIPDECRNSKTICEYLRITDSRDIYGVVFRTWYCSCEEETASSCIPSFKKEDEKDETN
jgi:hypothetical protein